MSTVLLDTNILIALEDPDRCLEDHCAEMLRNAPRGTQFYIHPIQFKDIERDKDEKRKIIFSSRVVRYKLLSEPPQFDDDYFAEQRWVNTTENDLVDNTLLACVSEPVVDYLVTNDKGIHAKARRSGIADRVLRLKDFEALINKSVDIPELACVNDVPCHTLDIADAFFDSLKEGYPEFDEWFERCCREQRKCWTIKKGAQLSALCIYKQEESAILDTEGFRPKGPILKLCTFKVAEDAQGSKVGERLLYMAFSYARQQNMNFVYLAVDEDKHPHLLSLMDAFGFVRYGKDHRGDRIVGKFLRPQTAQDAALEKAEYVKRFYPAYKADSDVGKYLIPIQREYHERLFPDASDFSQSLLGKLPEMYSSESNTIRKAYLCGSNVKSIESGDLLLFYRSQDRQSIEVLGVVNGARRLSDRERVMEMVKGRTVYSMWEIEGKLRDHPSGLLVICFDIIEYLKNAVPLERMKEIGVSCPQSICKISNEKFAAIMEAGR